MDTVNQIWEQVLEYIRPKLSPIAFDVYIKCMEPKSIEDGEMVVTVRTDFLKNNIIELYSELLLEALRLTLGIPLGLRIVSLEANVGDTGAVAAMPIHGDAFPTTLADEEFSFDNFVVGSGNKFAHAACQAVALQPCSTLNQSAGSCGLGCHLSDVPLDALQSSDGLTELDTLVSVLDSQVDSAFSNADSLCADADTCAVQSLHCDLEALVDLAQDVGSGNAAILEDQLSGLGACDTHLVLDLTAGEAGSALLNDESGDAAGALGGVGGSEDHQNAGACAAGDEALGAVQDVLVSLGIIDSNLTPAASEPALGSVRAKAPSSPPLVRRGRYFCFCSSVPYFRMAWGQIRWMDRVAAEDMHFFANSETAMTFSAQPPPTPPYSLGIPMPVRPISAIFLKFSTGK